MPSLMPSPRAPQSPVRIVRTPTLMGSVISGDGREEQEVRRRIEMRMEKIFGMMGLKFEMIEIGLLS